MWLAVESVKNNAVKHNNFIDDLVKRRCLSFDDAVKRAFKKIEQNLLLSSWKDNLQSDEFTADMIDNKPYKIRLFSLRSFGESFYHSISDSSLEFGYKAI